MKEKITRLAKGITELETPELVMLPESVSESLKADTEESFTVEFQSMNGYSVKGVCFSDALRVQPERASFAGRRADITVNIDTSGLSEGDTVAGALVFITNAGEKRLDYTFNIINNDAAFAKATDDEPQEFEKSPLIYASEKNEAMPEATKKTELPKSDDELEALAAELIRTKDESLSAFYVYKEAIRRGLGITRLYESYAAAYPDDCSEAMPREVLLYFSYERDIPHYIAEKLYADIVMHEASDSGIFDEFAAGMSAFAMNSAMSGRINRRLALIYDKVIYQGMIDRKAAMVLPDIFKCHEIRIDESTADCVFVSYNELGTSVKADISDGRAYVPVYFNDAAFKFCLIREEADDEGAVSQRYDDVTSGIRYSDKAVFDKPELLEKCFELYPEHPMLLLAACRRIVSDGIKDKKETGILRNALHELKLSEGFRKKIINTLCRAGGAMDWLSELEPCDYDKSTCGSIFSAFVKSGRLEEAFGLIKKFGAEAAEISELRRAVDGIIKKNITAVISDSAFVKLCYMLFEKKKASDAVIELLCRNYYGSIADMLHIFKAGKKRELVLSGLPERILSFELFSDSDDDIDEAFKAYIGGSDYDDLIVRAYLCVRSADYFLYEKNISDEIFFDALSGYMSSAEDPTRLPEICSIALTAHYARVESMSEDEKALCQRLSDRLIEEGLIFRYTKMLRKKIHIPEEISWKYYIEYRAQTKALPRLLVKILPDDAQYHQEDMRRVYRNVFVMSTALFVGDELHYLIYDAADAAEPSEEGVINVTKLHRQGNDRMRFINLMMKSLDAEDEDGLRESMLSYVENSETVKELFKLENV